MRSVVATRWPADVALGPVRRYVSDDPRVIGVSLSAVGLLHIGLVWASRHLTDGWVSCDLLRQRGGRSWKQVADEVMQAGLWSEGERNGKAGY